MRLRHLIWSALVFASSVSATVFSKSALYISIFWHGSEGVVDNRLLHLSWSHGHITYIEVCLGETSCHSQTSLKQTTGGRSLSEVIQSHNLIIYYRNSIIHQSKLGPGWALRFTRTHNLRAWDKIIQKVLIIPGMGIDLPVTSG